MSRCSKCCFIIYSSRISCFRGVHKKIEMKNKRFLRTIAEAYYIVLNDNKSEKYGNEDGLPPGKKGIWTRYFDFYNNKINELEKYSST